MGKIVPVEAEASSEWKNQTKTIEEEQEDNTTMNDSVCSSSRSLTIMKTSLFFAGDGFAVYDSDCQLVFRVDSYGGPDGHFRDEIYLMDGTGLCLLTLRRKRPSLHQRWEAYTGEGRDGTKPLFSVRRSSIIGRSTVTVETYTDTASSEYLIEGSFSQRNCTFYELHGDGDGRSVVAEITRKVDTSTNVTMGKDVFVLSLIDSGFDSTFAMGIVLVLDQISGDDGEENDDGEEEEEDGGGSEKTDSSE